VIATKPAPTSLSGGPETTPQNASAARRPGRPGRLLRAATGLLREVRPKQWVKNALVISVPLAAGRLHDPAVLVTTALAFAAMCCASSGVYLINDVHDRHEDRLHPVKRFRPVARGDVPVALAVGAAVTLLVAAPAVAWATSPPFAALVALYIALSLSYTWRLRRVALVEMAVVASGFVIRAAAGGVAANIPVSSWFLLAAGAGSIFVVAGKRASELAGHGARDGGREVLAEYSPGYLRFVWTAAATVTVVVYAAWANIVFVARDEGTWALWSVAPFALAVLRYAWDVDRGRAEAPEDVLWRDRSLLLLVAIWFVCFALGAALVDFDGH